jgi:YVTN family beta-propeller protein
VRQSGLDRGTVEFRILGALEVVEQGQPLALGGAKQRALLALLLLHANEPVASERLVAALWPAEPPPRGAASLQNYVSRLRKLLGRERLLSRPGGYLLALAPDELDLARFERLVRTARETRQPRQRAQRLREALAEWRGQPLVDLAAEPFAQAEIARLEDLRLAALEERIDAELLLGRHAELVGELQRLVAEQPLRERLCGQLMLALYRSGRQAEAFQAYEDAREALAEKFGIEPSRALKALQRQLLAQDPSLELPHEAPAEQLARPAPEPTPRVPAEVVTIVFSDIEGSTQLLHRLRDSYGDVLDEHRRLLRRAYAEHGGEVVETEGDGSLAVFTRPREALDGAVAAQRALTEHSWPEGVDVRVRMGMHTGEVTRAEGGYRGLAVHRAARICAAAHGGQVLLSPATQAFLEDEQLEAIQLRDLGAYPLRDFERRVRLYQPLAPGLRRDSPPPRTQGGRSRRRLAIVAGAPVLVVGAALAGLALMFSGGSGIDTAPVNSVAVIDPDRNALVESVLVGRRPTSVAAGHGAVWVVSADDRSVSHIDPSTRFKVGDIPIGAREAAVAIGRPDVAFAASLKRAEPTGRLLYDAVLHGIDPRTDTSLTVALGRVESKSAEVAVAVGVGSIWVAVGERLVRTDISNGLVLAKMDVPALRDVAVGEGGVWALGDAVRQVDVESNTIGDPVAVGPDPNAIAAGAGGIWVAVAGTDTVMRIDPVDGDPIAAITVGEEPVDVAVGEAGVWVANSASRSVSKIDPSTNKVVATIALGNRPDAITVGEGYVWVTVY